MSHEYAHWYCDNEIVLAAQQRRTWAMAIGSVVEHMHPLFGRGEPDEVYALGKSHADADREEFERRCKQYLQ